MRKFKNLCIYLLLFLLTCSIMFLPQFIDKHRQKQLVNQKVRWEYEEYVSAPLSCSDVIDFYFNSGTTTLPAAYDTNMINESASRLLSDVFAKDSEYADSVKELTYVKNIWSYNVTSMLTVNEDKPIALNFISVEYVLGNETLDITFEENTKTLLSALYWCDSEHSPKNEPLFSVDRLTTLFVNYASENMHLADERFGYSSSGNEFFEFNTLDSTAAEEKYEKEYDGNDVVTN